MLNEWWNRAHEQYNINNKDIHYLTHSNPVLASKRLNINSLLKPKNKILDIGVGTGNSTKYYCSKGLEVSAYDISIVALRRVQQITKNIYLPVDKLPHKYFDLTVSNLVAQHMCNKDLLNQITHIMYSIKDNGIFAMQFAESNGTLNESIVNQKVGNCCRTIEQMKELLNNINCTIVWSSYHNANDKVKFHYIHIKEKI